MQAPCSLVGNLRGPVGALVTSDGEWAEQLKRDADARVIEDWRIDHNTYGAHTRVSRGKARAVFAATWRATQLNLGRNLVGRSRLLVSKALMGGWTTKGSRQSHDAIGDVCRER
jgi:hypothetical protein